jgi:hypothetical protein
MGNFKDELAAKGWMLRAGSTQEQAPATHLFLDGGRAAVPDNLAGAFLNMYTNALLRGERVCCVELKSAVFRMFFDVDAVVAVAEEADGLVAAFEIINDAAMQFWTVSEKPRLVISSAPPKPDPDGTKCGFHLVWPTIFVNAPIALAFRAHVIELLQQSNIAALNSWHNVLDACVFKGTGLRMVFSDKGNEGRPYTPTMSMGSADGPVAIEGITAAEKRMYVHELSLRVFDQTLTPCRNGIEQLADDVTYSGNSGTSFRLEAFTSHLQTVQEALPAVYDTQRFVGAFRMEHAVMLRSSSRFCHNVDREHRTSTVYFCITRRGVSQRCYCRKEDAGCATFGSEWYHLPAEVIEAFLPPQKDALLEDAKDLHIMPSKKKETSSGNLRSILSKSRPVIKTKAKKKKGTGGRA